MRFEDLPKRHQERVDGIIEGIPATPIDFKIKGIEKEHAEYLNYLFSNTELGDKVQEAARRAILVEMLYGIKLKQS